MISLKAICFCQSLSSFAFFYYLVFFTLLSPTQSLDLHAYQAILYEDLYEFPKINVNISQTFINEDTANSIISNIDHIKTETDIWTFLPSTVLENNPKSALSDNLFSKNLFNSDSLVAKPKNTYSFSKSDQERSPFTSADSNELKYTAHFFKKHSQKNKLLCIVPQLNLSSNEFDDSQINISEEDKRKIILEGVALLDQLDHKCFSFSKDWWTYRYCHNQSVKQFHKPTTEEIQGKVSFPKLEFYLGMYSHRKIVSSIDDNLYQNVKISPQNNDKDDSLLNSDFDQSLSTEHQNIFDTTKAVRANRKWYLSQTWSGGTLCDSTNTPRTIDVQYHCGITSNTEIHQVFEVKTCSYIIIIHTPLLCNNSAFKSTSGSQVYNVNCFNVASNDLFDNLKSDHSHQVQSSFSDSLPAPQLYLDSLRVKLGAMKNNLNTNPLIDSVSMNPSDREQLLIKELAKLFVKPNSENSVVVDLGSLKDIKNFKNSYKPKTEPNSNKNQANEPKNAVRDGNNDYDITYDLDPAEIEKLVDETIDSLIGDTSNKKLKKLLNLNSEETSDNQENAKIAQKLLKKLKNKGKVKVIGINLGKTFENTNSENKPLNNKKDSSKNKDSDTKNEL
ncbi:hypothetical protein BB561_000422 [Smittium simulii]|uniref:Protein OS-9 homolog n=1 Tax=Smittium simulii TaxID=133385 RepID=A0A2T9YZD3_9FUNG|nr:hypothetical protein BB561_000422 [Smittium simulii]